MDIREILNYLISKGVLKNIQTVEPVTLGQGGAKIYKIETSSKNYILKIAYLSEECNENAMSSYRKEKPQSDLRFLICRFISLPFWVFCRKYIFRGSSLNTHIWA